LHILKTILLATKNKNLIDNAGNITAGKYSVVCLDDLKLLRHYTEEFMPSYLIISSDLEGFKNAVHYINNNTNCEVIITGTERTNAARGSLFINDFNKIEDLDKVIKIIDNMENEIKVNDSDSILPFDRIHLDTIPPTFTTGAAGIKIDDQIDKSIVKVSISGATDNSFDSNGNVLIEGSGIDRMIISNYVNFTTNGITAQSSVPFSTSVNHDLGLSLDNVVNEMYKEQDKLENKITDINKEIDKIEDNVTKIKKDKTKVAKKYHEEIIRVDEYTKSEFDSFFSNRYK
jgi:hypothetical protein